VTGRGGGGWGIAVHIRFCGHFSAISAFSAVNLTAENAEDAEKDAEA
jgi:hypothetical protein